MIVIAIGMVGCFQYDDVVGYDGPREPPPPPPTYSVIYDLGSATSGLPPIDDTAYRFGEMAIVRGNSGELALEGHVFAGWQEQADSALIYAADSTLVVDKADVTLVPRWLPDSTPSHNLRYAANGATSGVLPAEPQLKRAAEAVALAINSGRLARENYAFAGWNTAPDGSGTYYLPSITIAMADQQLTLYAQWISATVIRPTDGGEDDRFGGSVAIDGNHAIVGAIGSASFFERVAQNQWSERSTIPAPAYPGMLGDSDRSFGSRVAIDGDYAVVRSRYYRNEARDRQGAIYILQRSPSGDWAITTHVVAPEPYEHSRFADSVAIDGAYIIAGDFNADLVANAAGVAYIYHRDSAGLWNNAFRLLPSSIQPTASFGNSVSIDGDYAIVGADGERVDGRNPRGAVYVFRRNGVNTWTQEARLVHIDAHHRLFGHSVTIHQTTAVVGDPWSGLRGVTFGSATSFRRDSTGAWTADDDLLVPATGRRGSLGTTVAANDERIIVMGSVTPLDRSSGVAAMYVFERSTDGNSKLRARVIIEGAGDSWFNAPSVSIDGNRVIVGAPADAKRECVPGPRTYLSFSVHQPALLSIEGTCRAWAG